MIIVSFELGAGNADRPGGGVDSLGLGRPGPESRQPGRDEENFPRGLLRSHPHPASVPPKREDRDRGRRALLQLRILPAERQSKFKTGLPTPIILPPTPAPPPPPVGNRCRASSAVDEEGGGV